MHGIWGEERLDIFLDVCCVEFVYNRGFANAFCMTWNGLETTNSTRFHTSEKILNKSAEVVGKPLFRLEEGKGEVTKI